jgi:hypothetical protein
LLQYGGAAVITLAAIVLGFALKKEQNRKAELEQINKELSGSRDSINVLLDSKNQLLQSLQNAKDSLELATYDYHRKRAMDLFAQREYADASESFRQAINYITKDRQQDLPELRNYLVQSHSLQALRAKFDTLMSEGDRFRESQDNRNFKEAYLKYSEARKLNYDNDAVKVKLLLCRQYLEQEASFHLRRALTFLTKGNDPGLARATIEEYVNPIRNLPGFLWDASVEKEYEIVTAKLKTKK